MENIIYKSENIIPWDTQSAFKMTSYKTDTEEHMVFCYLKSYVHGGDLVLCSYCFTQYPTGKDSLRLYINLSPESNEKILQIDFGYDGVGNLSFDGKSIDDTDGISFRPFKTDDEQGFYWCGEIIIDAQLADRLYGIHLLEKSILSLNMVQTFENGDFSTLFGNALSENYSAEDNMNVFVVLNY